MAVLGAEHLWCIGHGFWGVALGKLPTRDNKDSKLSGSFFEWIEEFPATIETAAEAAKAVVRERIPRFGLPGSLQQMMVQDLNLK